MSNEMKDTYQGILVASDFSPPAQAALRQGLWVAEKSGCELTVAHVLPDLRKVVHSATYEARMDLLKGAGELFNREVRSRADHKLKQAIAELGHTKVKVTYETLLGEPFVEIIHAVHQEGYDLLVTGTRGASAWPSFFVGSTAKRLIRKCPASVWVVKAGHAEPPGTVLVAVDLSEPSRRALTEAVRIARWADAPLHVLHVVDSTDVPEDLLDKEPADLPRMTWRERVQEVAQSNFDSFLMSNLVRGIKPQRHLVWGSPWQEIGQLAKRLDNTLVVMGTVGRSGVQGLLLGNTAEKVLSTCDCSILTVKPAGFVSPIQPAAWQLHPAPIENADKDSSSSA